MNIPPHIIEFLNRYFDKILVVSLPRFSDRHQRVGEHLKGLDFEYFWGADKLELDEAQLKEEVVYDAQRAKQLHRQGKVLNPGEIACSLSHRMVYEEMVKKSWKKILILEDDVLPCFNALQLLPDALTELPADWELVYLGYLKHEKITLGLKAKQFLYKILSRLGMMKWTYKMVTNLLPKPYSTHLKKAGFHDCTHAYAIALSAAKKLSAAQTPVIYRADDLLSATIMKGELNAFVTDPKFFDQEIFHNPKLASEVRP